MAYRELDMVQVIEVLRLWLGNERIRSIARCAQVDRKTVRRYIKAARAEGLRQDGGTDQLTDALVGRVVVRLQPGAPPSRGSSWCVCEAHREFIASKLEGKLRLTKVRKLLSRHCGHDVPYRTLHRFASEELQFGATSNTVRVDDPPPAAELQVDFGRLGKMQDRVAGRNRCLWALIFTACFSRHCFVWPTFEQTLEATIDGFEAAWQFFGGVFKVVIPDNMKGIVDRADPLKPRINARFVDYAQARGFVVDPARVRSPKDKPRVERNVPYVREDFFRGESFCDLEDVRNRAVTWCLEEAGTRRHGTTRRKPLEVFEAEERGLLKPPPEASYDVPIVMDVHVHHDHHFRVGEALYSMPTRYIGERVTVRADCSLVRVYHRRALVKTHPRMHPGGRSTDPNDYPPEVVPYATRSTEKLLSAARSADEAIGFYTEQILTHPQPWSRMRHCHRLLGLVDKYGAVRVAAACRQAAELEVFDVSRIERMLCRAMEADRPDLRPEGVVIKGRFARDESDFAVNRKQNHTQEANHDDELLA